eukprot:SAG11_NODE_19350_length_468_cov_1.677507_1_plen_125_part_10
MQNQTLCEHGLLYTREARGAKQGEAGATAGGARKRTGAGRSGLAQSQLGKYDNYEAAVAAADRAQTYLSVKAKLQDKFAKLCFQHSWVAVVGEFFHIDVSMIVWYNLKCRDTSYRSIYLLQSEYS